MAWVDVRADADPRVDLRAAGAALEGRFVRVGARPGMVSPYVVSGVWIVIRRVVLRMG
jgi:hypothetical protein